MKLLLRGGLNKLETDGYKKSYLFEYSDMVKKLIDQGKKVAYVTIAKPDGHYDKDILPQFGEKVDILGRESTNVDWLTYDLIFLCGGTTNELKEGLLRTGFSFYSLKDNCVVLGDSAGAMLMAPFYYDTDDRINVEFKKGLYKETKIITAVHVNNPNYYNDILDEKVYEFAEENNLIVLRLVEHETKLFDESTGKFVDFEFDELFD